MCMLCVTPPGVIPSREKLENSALNNPHGYGFAIVVPEENRIIRERTMDADLSINRFLELRAQYMTGYAMWHARYATHGSRNVENCHPFMVDNDPLTYLGHNGILDVTIAKQDDRSDTRVFAEDILPAMGGITALDNDHVWRMLEDWTVGSKVCILTLDPKAKHQCYLLNQDAGKEDETGVWWSNDSCKLDYGYVIPKRKTSVSNYYSNWYSDKDYDLWDKPIKKDKDASYEDGDGTITCFSCESTMDEMELIQADGSCIWCGGCFDCGSTWQECMCYSPSKESKIIEATEVKQPVITGWEKDW